ncbi:hypothetical protein ILYODFUR_024446, partial [Ilyodon furcidens]
MQRSMSLLLLDHWRWKVHGIPIHPDPHLRLHPVGSSRLETLRRVLNMLQCHFCVMRGFQSKRQAINKMLSMTFRPQSTTRLHLHFYTVRITQSLMMGYSSTQCRKQTLRPRSVRTH